MEYPFQEGDRVSHIKDGSLVGVVVHIDRNFAHHTTCNVLWDGYLEDDIQWTNKLLKEGIGADFFNVVDQ